MRNRSKYKILYLTLFPHIGGGETSLLYLINHLNRDLFEPIVILPQPGQFSRRLAQDNISIYYQYLSPYFIRYLFIPGISLIGAFNLFRIIKKIRPSLIHVNHLTLAFYAGICGKILNIPIIATAHGPWDSYIFIQDIISYLFINKIVANTEEVAKSILKRGLIKKDKVEIIPFGVDTKYFKPGDKDQARNKLGLPKDSFVVTIVGRIDPIKDHLTFLKAADIVIKSYSNIVFYIVGSSLGDFSNKGDSYKKAIKKFLNTHMPLAERVKFAGYIDFMPSVYQASDILVSTSLFESFSLTLLEGAASGLSLIATNQGGANEVIKNGSNGYLINVGDHVLLAKLILKLAKNRSLREKFGKKSREYTLKKPSLDNYTRKIETVYLNLIK
ncbi:glycosyltransferase family 4 protein [Candidatus Daviesbacteria bacterium]|nr:glycosyltransferase family 4 protein [Candidatus Daviesbacteria bacterium]